MVDTRDQWWGHPEAPSIYKSVLRKIDEQYALVPEGYVSLPQTITDYPGCAEMDIETPAFFLARCAVTNSQFQKFVDAGGYDNLDMCRRIFGRI
jgi:formylglycine-generating enzyme required for sulfatase activity